MLSLLIICIYFLTVTTIQGLQELKWLSRFNTMISLNPLFWLVGCKKFVMQVLQTWICLFENFKAFYQLSEWQTFCLHVALYSFGFDCSEVRPKCSNVWLWKPLYPLAFMPLSDLISSRIVGAGKKTEQSCLKEPGLHHNTYVNTLQNV